MVAARPALDRFLDAELARYRLIGERLVVAGFSQGTMLALHVGLRRNARLAAVVGYSGLLAGPERLSEIAARPPVLLIHGEADTTVPIAEGRRLAALAGPNAEHWTVPGADHSGAHAVAGQDYERRVTDFLRMAFTSARGEDADRAADVPGPRDMMTGPGPQDAPPVEPSAPAMPGED